MKNSLVVLLIGMLLVSCHKEEIAVPAHDSGDALEVQIGMGEDYRYQLFYNLGNNEVVSTNDKSDWDLAFESSPTGWHIVMNTSRGMAVHKEVGAAFDAITSDAGLTWNWDEQSGSLDSTAIGDWQSISALYVIDMGYNHLGDHLGFKKMMINSVSSDEFEIEYGELTDVTSQTTTIAKNEVGLFTHFKFGTGEVTITPPNADWDLVFTQYTHLFYDPLEAYVVTGVLLNRFNTSAARIDNIPFSDITYDDVTNLTYSAALNYIGYDWKAYDYNNAVYTVDPAITYIVQTSGGYYYKLHFIDFYNSLGEKGYPKMEVQQL